MSQDENEITYIKAIRATTVNYFYLLGTTTTCQQYHNELRTNIYIHTQTHIYRER